MTKAIVEYNNKQSAEYKVICDLLKQELNTGLPNAESKIWHAQPVWFLDGNPIAGYVVLKERVRLMFWSGADFEEKDLEPGTGKFKDAHIDYTSLDQLDGADIQRWLSKSKKIQWNYKNLIKNKGKLEKI